MRRVIPAPTRHALKARWDAYRFDRAVRELKGVDRGTVPTDALLTRLRAAWGNLGWSGDLAYLHAVCKHATTTSGQILECGSGLTTILLSALVGGRRECISLEHMGEWCERVEAILSRHHLPSPLHHAPLAHYAGFDWYETDLLGPTDRFGLVICDGPPGSTLGGRYGLLPLCRDRLSPDCVILVDDVERPEDRAMLDRWRREFGVVYHIEATGLGDYAVAVSRQSRDFAASR